jgi:hypothetical protein
LQKLDFNDWGSGLQKAKLCDVTCLSLRLHAIRCYREPQTFSNKLPSGVVHCSVLIVRFRGESMAEIMVKRIRLCGLRNPKHCVSLGKGLVLYCIEVEHCRFIIARLQGSWRRRLPEKKILEEK